MGTNSRRSFVKNTIVAGIGISVTAGTQVASGRESAVNSAGGTRIGMIGLDTSHCVAFAKALNGPDAGTEFSGYRVVVAYPHGSRDIVSSTERIPKYTEEVKKLGVAIAGSIDELLAACDVVMLETNDGRLHLEQALPVIKAGKRLFIDKPMTASLADAMLIFEAARKQGVPLFSSSSLRYISGMDEIKSGIVGKVLGAETYSPAKLEKTHPDLFWYGIHGIETLFTLMGIGCISVSRTSNEDCDLVVGSWSDNRIGTFRGIRKGAQDYGGIVFGEKAIKVLGGYGGYNPLLKQIITFFDTGIVPVREEETIEILAFMEAAEMSKANNGAAIPLKTIMDRAVEQNAGRKTN